MHEICGGCDVISNLKVDTLQDSIISPKLVIGLCMVQDFYLIAYLLH